jgi:hypothetical protein
MHDHQRIRATRGGAFGCRRLTQFELAQRWRISGRTLEKWRQDRCGPPYLKIGGRVVYRLEDVEAFEAEQLRGTP